jgi:hypothetical protein
VSFGGFILKVWFWSLLKLGSVRFAINFILTKKLSKGDTKIILPKKNPKKIITNYLLFFKCQVVIENTL